MSIQQLPDHVVAQIKSSATVTSLSAAVYGLVKNSLDAGATKITISVDFARGNCSVEDNGTGILPTEFLHSGGLCKPHHTSRFPPNPALHGRSGTFLSSLAALSLLSITSHHHRYTSHNTIKIHNSDVLARQTPCPSDQRLLVFPHGTRVTVRNLFGSMPVRVKQRAQSADRTTANRDYALLKHAVTALLLAWPAYVAVSLRDPWTHQSIVIRGSQPPAAGAPENEHCGHVASRVCRALCQAGLSDESSVDSWVAIKARAGSLRLIGAVCLVPSATKRAQFISIGVQPLPNERGPNVLYEEINQLFSSSSFGFEEEINKLDDAERGRRAQDGRYKTDSYTTRELRGKKRIDRWPVFYVNIDIHEQGGAVCAVEDALDERRQTLAAIIDILRATTYEFLRKHRFRPKFARPTKSSVSGLSQNESHTQDAAPRGNSSALFTAPFRKASGGKHSTLGSRDQSAITDLATTRLRLPSNPTTRSTAASPFDMWTRVKSGRPAPEVIDLTDEGGRIADPVDSATKAPTAPGSPAAGARAPADYEEQDHLRVTASNGEDHLIWTNPATKQKSLVNQHTGFIISPRGAEGSHTQTTRSVSESSRQQSQVQELEAATDVSAWLEDLLFNWHNPVFATVEVPIPAAPDIDKILNPGGMSQKGGCCAWRNANPYGNPGLAGIEGRVSRDALRNAEVIAQVDRKFIFARVPLHTGLGQDAGSRNPMPSLLIMVDQHAADERCLVEALMKNYFATGDSDISMQTGARTESLERALQFEVSAQERTLFERYASEFRHWGIAYEVPPVAVPRPGLLRSGSMQPSSLKILSLPPSIAERCRVEPRLLIELLRKEVWRFEEQDCFREGQSLSETRGSRKTGQMETQWLSQLHGCPRGIQDMIHSRACRSAIMFNDVLSLDECRGLLRRLADCAFPFQCAHGRPAMVPLVDLGNPGHLTVQTYATEHRDRFGKLFKQWKAAKTSSREQ